MKELPIQNRKFKVLIDDEDEGKLCVYDWYASGQTGKQIRRFVKPFTGYTGETIITLQSMIMGDLKMYDHIDRNPLNFQKHNLRIATQSHNRMNSNKTHNKKSSKYKGVSYCQRDKCWRAHIKINGVGKALGSFKTERMAARAYNEAALKLFGEFAAINNLEGSAGTLQS